MSIRNIPGNSLHNLLQEGSFFAFANPVTNEIIAGQSALKPCLGRSVASNELFQRVTDFVQLASCSITAYVINQSICNHRAEMLQCGVNRSLEAFFEVCQGQERCLPMLATAQIMIFIYLTQKSAAANFGRGSLPLRAFNANMKRNSCAVGGWSINIFTWDGRRRYRKSIPACDISGSLDGSKSIKSAFAIRNFTYAI